MKRTVIFKNSAECKLCGDVIESKHRHDFVSCKCGEIFVDGGKEYLRAGFRNRDNFINRSETGEMPIVEEDENRDTKKTRN